MTNERKNRLKGILGTILFHVGLVILLLFLALRTPLPLPGEEGVLVNYGFDETGMGTDQQEEQASVEPIVKPAPVPQETVKEDYLVQDIEEAPAIEEKKIDIKKKEPEKVIPKPEPEPEPQPEPQPEPEPQPAPQPEKPQRITFDLFSDGTGNILADRFREGQEKRISDKFQENKIVDLRTTIGINDKFLFINELFEGNMRIYDEVLQKLNSAVTMAQAELLMLDLKIAYNWDSESPTVKKFVELVRRKF